LSSERYRFVIQARYWAVTETIEGDAVYVQKLFEETRLEVLHDFIEANPLGALVTSLSGQMDANLLPIDLVRDHAPYGMLHGHVSRSNPLLQRAESIAEAMVIFQGPNAYISPQWFVNGTKSGRNAPSWYYVTVHAYGTIRMVDEPAWLHAHLHALTNRREKGRVNPWTLANASPDFVNQMIKGVVGFEITVTRLVGKWFLGQQRTQADRESVALSLSEDGTFGTGDIAKLILAQSPQTS